MSKHHSADTIPAVDLDSSKIRRGLTPTIASVDDAIMRAEISWPEIGLLCGMARNRRDYYSRRYHTDTRPTHNHGPKDRRPTQGMAIRFESCPGLPHVSSAEMPDREF